MSTIKINQLATSDVNLTDFVIKADGAGVATKNTVQGLSDVINANILELGKNKSKLNEFLEGYYFNNADGVITASASFFCTGLQPVIQSTSYTMSNDFIRFFPNMHFFDTSGGWLGNQTTLGVGVLSNDIWTFTTPASCYYVGFTVYASDFANFQEFKNGSQLELGSVKTTYEAPKQIIKASLLETDPLINALQIDVDSIYVTQNYESNENEKYNLKNAVSNDFYRPSNLNRIETITNTHLNNIGVTKGVVYGANEVDSESSSRNMFFKKEFSEVINSQYYQIQFFLKSTNGDISDFDVEKVFVSDENSANLSQLTGVTTTTELVESGLWRVKKSGQISNPSTQLKELWIGSNFTLGGDNTKDLTISGFYCYTSVSVVDTINFENPKQIINEIESLKDRVTDLEATPYNIDKVAWWLGDSITDDDNYYLNKLNEKLTFSTQYNIANSGAKFSHTSATVYDITSTGGGGADWNVTWNQVNKMIDLVNNSSYLQPDLILLSAGTNDFYGTVGTPSTIYDGLSFTTLASGHSRLQSLAGGLRYTCDTILENYPNVQIVLIAPIQRGLVDNSVMFEIIDAMIESGGLGSMEVIDQGRKCGIYGYPEIASDIFLTDNLHPTPLGGQKMANFLLKALKNVIVE
tara:strand:+ start:213 stop:2123 length:1911 start_codon:yes stop_codon:yes gene_type:complete